MDIQLTNDITNSPGAYAWLKCASGVHCVDELKTTAGIEGTSGVNYGATNDSKTLIATMLHLVMVSQTCM